MVTFTIGALIAWRLEGRRPLVSPLWLVVARNLSVILTTAFIVVVMDPPTAIVAVDPIWWNALELVVLGGSVAAFAIELRYALRGGKSA